MDLLQRRMPWWLWATGLLGLVAFGTAVGLVWQLFPGASQKDQLAAAGAILGGFIGAAGTALAVYLTVYLTLASQRADEAQKVETALRIETAELARLALGSLGLCEMVLDKGYKIPLRDLPVLMFMPDAPVFKATVDRISRLAYGPLFVVLHARIAEALQMVRINAVAPPTPSGVGERIAAVYEAGQAQRVLEDDKARTLAIAWFDVCQVAQSILTRDPRGFEIAEAAAGEVLKDLGDAVARIQPLIAPHPKSGD